MTISDRSSSSQQPDGLAVQLAHLDDALGSENPALVVMALKEIGTTRRIPVVLDENPPLGDVLRVLRALGIGLMPMRFEA